MKSKRKGILPFFMVMVLILALTYTAFFGIKNYYGDKELVYFKGADDIRWGIDIRGGVEAVFSPDKKDIEITDDDIDAAKSILETRLVNQNITDYEIYADNANKQIIVRFPWASGESDFDAAAAVQELGATALLKFCREEDSSKVILTGADVKKATPAYQQLEDGSYQYVVQLDLKDSGKSAFSAATGELVEKTISIWMDDTMISAPTVSEQITDGIAIITMSGGTAEDAEDLADKINAGSLPFALTVDDSKLQVISPTLGNDALKVMVIAGAVAFALVCLLMIARYRINGVVAALALLGQLAGSIACISGYFASFDSFTLTIPGIAGIILSIGVGVDCNVIAAERIRDEFQKGKTIDGAIDSGYKNSLSAIIDGNVTIVIVSIVLMGAFGTPDSILAQIFSPIMSLFGTSITGSIYSFGYTLLVGVIFNLIMGVLASRIMIKGISRIKAFRNPALYGGKKNA